MPIAEVVCTSGGYSNINQVFNGTGFFNNCVFYTKGLKILASDGRYPDGTMKNIEYTTTNCHVEYFSPSLFPIPALLYFFINSNDGSFWNISSYSYYETPTQPITTDYAMWYNTDYNILQHKTAGALETTPWVKLPLARVFSIEVINGNFVNIHRNNSLELLNRGNISVYSAMGMPSNTYISFTVGVNGASYTAPANGWFAVFNNTSRNSWAVLQNNANGLFSTGVPRSGFTDGGTYMPVKKGDVVNLYYIDDYGYYFNGYFRFVYAIGEIS